MSITLKNPSIPNHFRSLADNSKITAQNHANPELNLEVEKLKASHLKANGLNPVLGLKLNDSGAKVLYLQQQLNAHNTSSLFPDIKADGDFGTETEALVLRFQKARGLEASGQIDEPTSRALEAKAFSKSEVTDIQILLNQTIPPGTTPLKSDGVIGPKTHQAILSFQKTSGLSQTGVLDTITTQTLLHNSDSKKQGKLLGLEKSAFGNDNKVGGVQSFSLQALQSALIVEKEAQNEFTSKVKKSSTHKTSGAQLDQSGIRDRSTALYEAIHGGVAGFGTDESTIQMALEGLSAADCKLIHEDYNHRFPTRDLIKDLKGDLSGADLDFAKALFSGDQRSADIAGIQSAIEGFGTNKQLVYSILEKNADKIDSFKTEFKEQTGKKLEDYIDGDMDFSDFKRAQALLVGNIPKSDAIALHQALDGDGTNEAVVDMILGKYMEENGSSQSSLEVAYEKMNGASSFLNDIKDDFEGTDLKRTLAMAGFASTTGSAKNGRLSADQKVVNMKIAELDQAFDYGIFATDEDKIRNVFKNTTPEQREQVILGYNKQHKESLGDKFKSELTKFEQHEMEVLAGNGELNTIETVFYSMKNGDINDAINTLKNLPLSDINQMRADWKASGYGDMDEILLEHSKGLEIFGLMSIQHFDMKDALEGNLSELSPQERAIKLTERANLRAELEQDTWGNDAVNLFAKANDGSVHNQVMQANLDRLNAVNSIVKEDFATNPASAQIVSSLAENTLDDAQNVHSAKSQLAQNSAMIGGFIGAAVVTGGASVVGSMTLGGAVAATAAGAATSVGINTVLNTQATSTDLQHSAYTGAVGGASLGIGIAAKGAAVGVRGAVIENSVMMGVATGAEENWAEGEAALKTTAAAFAGGAAIGYGIGMAPVVAKKIKKRFKKRKITKRLGGTSEAK